MKLVSKIIVFGMAVAALSSCVDLDIEKQKKNREDANSRNFTQLVGKIDKDQTWNLAKKANVTVSTAKPTEVKLITLDNKLVAKKTVDGTEKISFDIATAESQIKVVTSDVIKLVNLESSVNLGTVSRANSVDPETVKGKVAGEYFHLVNDSSTTKIAVDNIVSDAKSITIGTYYYDANNEKVEEVLWEDLEPGRSKYNSGAVDFTLDANSNFGVFAIVDGTKFYSEAKYNADGIGHAKYVDRASEKEATSGAAYIFIEDTENESDCNNIVLKLGGGEDIQLADMSVYAEDQFFTVGCEDTYGGSFCDWDYNDVVFSVAYVSGTGEATLTFIAAGSTVANDLYFGDVKIGEIHDLLWNGKDSYDDFDSAGKKFTTTKMVKSYQNGKYNGKEYYNMINTNKNGCVLPVVSRTIDVPEDFSMADGKFGGFVIKRYEYNEDDTLKYTFESQITAPTKGGVPYMICVDGTFRYPSENANIDDVYPEFTGWSQNHTQYLDWHRHLTDDEEKAKLVY